ncbi:MAG: hypothetical protein KKF89_05220 [Nanoarchaeota archaeon]|nr:hypothetical protein [Nanoarchaeota archaeon]MBU1855095.1 hypothetical protein [Nanoarchaeota archaeon]
MTRKAQMEIMGLLVIVILLTLGMFFVVSFKTQTPKRDIKTSYEDDQLASNFIITLLKTTSDCTKYNMEELIQDCAAEKRLRCSDMDSCTYVNQTINDLLGKTFEKWGKKFRFEIENMNEGISFESNCGSQDEKDSAFQPISLYPYPGTIILRMDICE